MVCLQVKIWLVDRNPISTIYVYRNSYIRIKFGLYVPIYGCQKMAILILKFSYMRI